VIVSLKYNLVTRGADFGVIYKHILVRPTGFRHCMSEIG